MSLNYEDAVKIAREAIGGLNRPSDLPETFNPVSYDPPEWVMDAIRAAHHRGTEMGRRLERAERTCATEAPT